MLQPDCLLIFGFSKLEESIQGTVSFVISEIIYEKRKHQSETRKELNYERKVINFLVKIVNIGREEIEVLKAVIHVFFCLSL